MNPLFEYNEKGKFLRNFSILYNDIYTEKDYIENEIMINYNLSKKQIQKLSIKEYTQKILHLKIKKEETQYYDYIKLQNNI